MIIKILILIYCQIFLFIPTLYYFSKSSSIFCLLIKLNYLLLLLLLCKNFLLINYLLLLLPFFNLILSNLTNLDMWVHRPSKQARAVGFTFAMIPPLTARQAALSAGRQASSSLTSSSLLSQYSIGGQFPILLYIRIRIRKFFF